MRLLPVILAILVAAACGSDGSRTAAPDKATTTEEAPETATPTETAPPQKSLEERPPSRDEVAWVGRVAQWSYDVGLAVEVAASAFTDLAEGRVMKPGTLRPVVQALRRVAKCTRTYDRLAGDAPSVRLEDIAAALRDACESYEAGAAAALELTDGGLDVEAVDTWDASWSNAIKIVANASDVFGDFQPANLERLPRKRGPSKRSRIEPVFSAVSTAVTPPGGAFLNDHQVRCWSKREWSRLVRATATWSGERVTKDTLGFVGYAGDHRINLAPEVCDALVALRYERERPREEPGLQIAAFAVGILTHEGEHARGVASEAAATCYGMQRIRRAARKLGADAGYAKLLAETFWADVYPLVPRGYATRACRNGGPLDINRKRASWP